MVEGILPVSKLLFSVILVMSPLVTVTPYQVPNCAAVALAGHVAAVGQLVLVVQPAPPKLSYIFFRTASSTLSSTRFVWAFAVDDCPSERTMINRTEMHMDKFLFIIVPDS